MNQFLRVSNANSLDEILENTDKLNFIQQKERFKKLFDKVSFPITLVIENYYSDRDYKDSYYHFFASKYHNFDKYSHRIAIFEGEICEEKFYNQDFSIEDKLIGVVTIRPFKIGCIGKTFFNPKKLKLNKSLVRTTDFEIGLLGRRIHINSFPFSSQDGEYMTCAETALWAILQYYGARYKEYRVALPHEIVGIADNESYQRVSPSRGLNYTHISKVLKNFGFSPQIYSSQMNDESSKIGNQDKRLLHYYVESGIPLMVGIKFKNKQVGHIVLCVGRENKIPQNIRYEKCKDYEIANSADFTEKYIFIDDNKIPFISNKLDDYDCSNKTAIKYFIVPLYKRIFLGAEKAEKIFYEILQDEALGLKNISTNPIPIIIKIFLVTSRNYKVSKFQALQKFYRVLDRIPLPKFLWICEISTEEQYKKNKISGEIVLDATASEQDKFDSIILLRYPMKFAYKSFNEDVMELRKKISKNLPALKPEAEFDSFKLNLMEVGNG